MSKSTDPVEDKSTTPPADPQGTPVDPTTDEDATTDVKVVVADHVAHALAHGLTPQGRYSLAVPSDVTLYTGTLLGTSDIGVLFHTDGSAAEIFFPWAGVKSLTHL